MLSNDDLPSEVTASGFKLPKHYFRVFELGLTNLEPWYFVNGPGFEVLYRGLLYRYPDRLTVPFARRRDNDDLACFVAKSDTYAASHILLLHDYSSPGSEVDVELAAFADWFLLAVKEMLEWT
jgi:hypothetical protein